MKTFNIAGMYSPLLNINVVCSMKNHYPDYAFVIAPVTSLSSHRLDYTNPFEAFERAKSYAQEMRVATDTDASVAFCFCVEPNAVTMWVVMCSGINDVFVQRASIQSYMELPLLCNYPGIDEVLCSCFGVKQLEAQFKACARKVTQKYAEAVQSFWQSRSA